MYYTSPDLPTNINNNQTTNDPGYVQFVNERQRRVTSEQIPVYEPAGTTLFPGIAYTMGWKGMNYQDMIQLYSSPHSAPKIERNPRAYKGEIQKSRVTRTETILQHVGNYRSPGINTGYDW